VYKADVKSGIQIHLLNGGSAGALASVPIVAVGVLLQSLVMAEMASMCEPYTYPTYCAGEAKLLQDTIIRGCL
jgi:hypothetical protein